jgi:hypothetical protein
MNEIQILNEYLLKKSEMNRGEEWRKYYLGLIDLDKQHRFRISSCDSLTYNPLIEYLNKHEKEYNIFPATGSCEYVKK